MSKSAVSYSHLLSERTLTGACWEGCGSTRQVCGNFIKLLNYANVNVMTNCLCLNVLLPKINKKHVQIVYQLLRVFKYPNRKIGDICS